MKPDAAALSFGELLRKHRSAIGLSQEALADRAAVSAAAIGALERGRRRAPYAVTVASLADALELTPADRIVFIETAKRTRGRRARAVLNASGGPGAVPAFLSSFIGRAEELAMLGTLLRANRLVTITGSGGVGKTRIACELLDALPQSDDRRVAFVDLASISDPAFIVGNIGRALGIDGADSQDALLSAIAGQPMLLVLDNCEHLIHTVAPLARAILLRCPGVSLLSTSRERLGIPGETVYRLPSLQFPSETRVTIDESSRFSALKLFIERTRSVDLAYAFSNERLGFTIEICRRLNGIPLAIELAAARVPLLGLVAIRDRLFEQFLLANGDPESPERQRTMTATIAWSYDLLDDDGRALLRRLAIFVGGFTLGAAEIVCADSDAETRNLPLHFTRLVEAGLVNANTAENAARYGLAESTRRFALDRLSEAQESRETARRHARWLAEIADHAYSRPGTAHLDVVQQIAKELENVRAALDWTLASDADDDAVIAGRILGGLRFLWIQGFRRVEYRNLVQQALRRIDGEIHPQIVANLYRGLIQSMSGTEIDDALLKATTKAFERIDDYDALVSLSAHLVMLFNEIDGLERAEATAAAGHAYVIKGNIEGSRAHNALLINESEVLAYRGEFEKARCNLQLARGYTALLGMPELEIYRRNLLCLVEAASGDVPLATRIALDALEYAAAVPETPSREFIIDVIKQILAVLFSLQDDVLRAFEYIEAPKQTVIDLPHLHYVKYTLQSVATIAGLKGRFDLSARLLGFIDSALDGARVRRDIISQLSCDKCLAMLKAACTETELDVLFTEGARLTFAQAADEALEMAGSFA